MATQACRNVVFSAGTRLRSRDAMCRRWGGAGTDSRVWGRGSSRRCEQGHWAKAWGTSGWGGLTGTAEASVKGPAFVGPSAEFHLVVV